VSAAGEADTRPGDQDAERLFLAAERSLLAWTRTCAALMGLGFLIERFRLDLEATAPGQAIAPHFSFASLVGLGLMGLSALLAALSTLAFRDILKTLGPRRRLPTRFANLGVITNLGLASLGIMLTIYLAVTNDPEVPSSLADHDSRSAIAERGHSMSNSTDSTQGIVRIACRNAVGATVDRLEALLKERGVLVFARIDFSGDAARAGLTMRPEQMLIFGNPKAGTPLMQAAPIAGLDLPMKALVWEDADGKTWLAYNEPKYVIQRHGLAPTFSANLAAVVPLLEKAAQE